MRLLAPVVAFAGEHALVLLQRLGAAGLVAARTVARLPRTDGLELKRKLGEYGWGSMPLVLWVATLTGATVILQSALYVERLGARSFLGWAAGYSVFWEFGPLLLGMLMAARIGAQNAAELALLRINGQIEGLRGISLDPVAVLVAPRVLAIFAVVTLSSVISFLFAILWEIAAAVVTLALPPRAFLASFAMQLSATDMAAGMVKSGAYGLAIALVSTSIGLTASGGARGVGRATAASVVWSCAAIFTLDFALTPPLTRVLG